MTAVPMAPMEAPTSPLGLPANEFVPHGREAQSIAFFNAPGMERLYSGEMNSSPSEASMALLSSLPTAGNLRHSRSCTAVDP